jgi:hypothetical protein
MAHFFATADDLLLIFSKVEARRNVLYTPTGHIDKAEVASYRHGSELPTLREPAASESAVNCPSYLITKAEQPIVLRELTPFGGGSCWAVDQLLNLDSAVLSHGGMFEGKLLLHGRVATAAKSSVAKSLQRSFESQIRSNFSKIKAFYVGRQAEELLDSGFRLTSAAQSPPEYDLCR